VFDSYLTSAQVPMKRAAVRDGDWLGACAVATVRDTHVVNTATTQKPMPALSRRAVAIEGAAYIGAGPHERTHEEFEIVDIQISTFMTSARR